MSDFVDAACVEPGQYIFQRSGTYLVDAIAVKDGRAYIGTDRGVLVLPATAPVLVADG